MDSETDDTNCNDRWISIILDRITKAGMYLLSDPGVRKFCSSLVEIKRDVEEAGRNIGVGVDLQVVMVVEDLKVLLHEVECKVGLYVTACVNMAEYVTDDLMDSLNEDLDAGSVEELSDFMEDISTLMEVCVKRLDDFGETKAKFTTEVKERGDQWKDKRQDMAEREEKSTKLACATVGAVGAALIAIPVFGVTALASVTIMAGGVLIGGVGVAAIFVLDAGISQQQKEIFVHACKRLAEFYEALSRVRETAQSMEKNMQEVISYLGHGTDEETSSSQGLRGYAKNPKKKTQKDGKTILRHERMIKFSLKSLCTAMTEVLSQAKSFPACSKGKDPDS